MQILPQISGRITRALENVFQRLGKIVATYPFSVILATIFVSGLCCLGILNIRTESRGNKLWLPPDSNFNIRKDWLNENFKTNSRRNFHAFQAENILTPEALRSMYKVHKAVHSIEVNGKKFEDLCERVSIADIFQAKKRRKRETNITEEDDYVDDIWYGVYDEYEDQDERETDFTRDRINYKKYSKKNTKTEDDKEAIDSLPENIYCDLVNTLNSKCKENSILDIWQYKEDLINTATQQEIIDAVNLLERSPWFGYDKDYSRTLGGITRNKTGHIVAAKSELMVFILNSDDENVDISKGGGAEFEFVDETTLAWESEFIKIGLNSSTVDLNVMVDSPRSFSDISAETVFVDSKLMVSGYIIMFIYTILMLGKINFQEMRLFLTITGLLCIVMGMGIAIGLSAALGYPYTPVNVILPFICLGIGIDDMFVISQCWYNMKKDPCNTKLSLPDQMGVTLKHARVSITITTVTDVFAFGVGAFSLMPGIQSFCVCTALALGSIYLLQITWFVAWMSLDEKRIAVGRNGCLPCIVLEISDKSATRMAGFGELLFKNYNQMLYSLTYKVVIAICALFLMVFGIWGCISIHEQFKFLLILPEDSYLRQWAYVRDDLYSGTGWTAEIFTDSFNHSDLAKFENLSTSFQQLEKSGKYITSFDDWWTELKEYALDKKNFTNWRDFANSEDFPKLLTDFLFSSYGSKFKANFKFAGDLICNNVAPMIMFSKLEFDYQYFDGTSDNIPAKIEVEKLIQLSGIPGAFSFSSRYSTWETEAITAQQLRQNIGLALACVFLVSLVMLPSIPICFMILLIVSLTLIDIIGFLHFWDISIDFLVCTYVVLSIGLCVDYAVHIGHAYLIQKGSQTDKAIGALTTIGPAVLNGGITTFLACFLTAFSRSYVFISFFKVFFLTVLLGLFHGLVLFPVMLTLAGPTDAEEHDLETDTKDKDEPDTDTEISKTNDSKRQLAGHINDGFN